MIVEAHEGQDLTSFVNFHKNDTHWDLQSFKHNGVWYKLKKPIVCTRMFWERLNGGIFCTLYYGECGWGIGRSPADAYDDMQNKGMHCHLKQFENETQLEKLNTMGAEAK